MVLFRPLPSTTYLFAIPEQIGKLPPPPLRPPQSRSRRLAEILGMQRLDDAVLMSAQNFNRQLPGQRTIARKPEAILVRLEEASDDVDSCFGVTVRIIFEHGRITDDRIDP